MCVRRGRDARGDMAAATTPVRALSDDLAFTDSSPEPRALAFATARRAGARVVRITLDWSRVAPEGSVKPPGFRAADPADPAYRWGYVEDAVRDAAARHLRVLLVIDRAPAWAGEQKPDPGELGASHARRRGASPASTPTRRAPGTASPGVAGRSLGSGGGSCGRRRTAARRCSPSTAPRTTTARCSTRCGPRSGASQAKTDSSPAAPPTMGRSHRLRSGAGCCACLGRHVPARPVSMLRASTWASEPHG